MPIEVEEKFESRESQTGSNAWIERLYLVRGTDDDLAAKAALGDTAPSLYDGLTRQSRHIERIGEQLWLGTAHYARSESSTEPPETGDSVFSFDTGGGTQHITQSLATVGSYPGDAPDHQGAIGVTADAVEGVDITVPVYHFSETHYIPASQVTLGYRGDLFHLTGKVNNAGFRGLAAGECLFLGASGSQRGAGEDWEISFRFAGSPNRTGLSVGSITGITKKGWEYLWVRYEDVEDELAHAMVK
ncbi:MAG: hypothetical protein WD800_09005, partial [Dehalococcoidia bacterium]